MKPKSYREPRAAPVLKPVQIERAEQLTGAAQERKHAEEALRHFRAAMDVLADMIMLVDRATMRYIDVNATACEMQGYTREEMLRMGPQDVSPASKEALERAYDETIASGKTTRLESYHHRRDGTRFPVEICRRAVRAGKRWIIVSVVRDISERMRAEQLQNLEHAVAQSLADAESASTVMTAVIRAVCNTESWECGRYFRVDEGAGVLRFSEGWGTPDPAIERFLRDSRDLVYERDRGLVGKVWKSGQPLWTTDIEGDPRAQRAALSQEVGIQGAFVFPVTSEGKTIGVLAFSSRKPREPDERLLQAVHAIGGQIGQFLQRKLAEEVLRESEARFRALNKLSADWYWEQDEHFRFVQITGRDTSNAGTDAPHRYIGKTRWETSLEIVGTTWEEHRAALEARRPFHDLLFRRQHPDGGMHYTAVSGEPVFDDKGAFKGYRGIGQDITERKREEQLRTLEHAVTRGLAGADSPSTALKAVIRAVCETQGWECGRYWRVDEQAGVLRFGESWSVPDPMIEQFIAEKRKAVFGPGVGLAGRVWQTGEPAWIADTTDDARALRAAIALKIGLRGAFHFPVKSDGKTIGVLAFNSRQVREPDERLLQAVRAIGSQIGQFLQRKQGEEELRRFRAAIDVSADLVLLVDPASMLYVDTNETACRALGYTRGELLAMSPHDIFSASREDLAQLYERLIAGDLSAMAAEGWYRRKDGSRLVVESFRRAVPSAKGHVIVSVARDVGERKRAEQLLKLEHSVTRSLAEANSAPAVLEAAIRTVCETEGWECGRYFHPDEKAGVMRFGVAWGVPNEAVERYIAGSRDITYPPGVGLMGRVWQSGQPLWVSDLYKDARVSQPTLARESGIHGAFVFPVISEGKTIGVLAFNSREVREPEERLLQAISVIGSQIGQFLQRKNAEDKLAQLAQFDTVTGLPNRYLFHDRLGLMLTQAQRNNWLIGTLFVDLDRFKAVNDTYGHDAGDKLLRQVAARLKECVRGGDTVGRLSGDEFAVMLSNLAKADDAGLVAQKIVSALAAPFDLDGHRAYISASIGIALYPGDGDKPDTLIKNADTAMYRAKQQGRNGYQFFLPEINERLMQRTQLEAHLRGALERGEYLLHYQPKTNLDTGAITGFEALLRWRHGDLTVSPAEFIPILEDTGLIVPVGEWVLRSVCEQLKRWEQQGVTVRPVAVNLSARQFQRENLAAVVGRVLEETGVRPDLLELELTETLLMSDAGEAVQTLHQFKSLGVRLTMDDFGTGYSSLAYLKRFPLDALKIDRAFIRDIASDPDAAAITITIISLAHNLKLKVVAEGVETEGQLQFLRLHGCDEMQGFYFARPLPVEECTRALIEDRRL